MVDNVIFDLDGTLTRVPSPTTSEVIHKYFGKVASNWKIVNGGIMMKTCSPSVSPKKPTPKKTK